MLLVRGVVEDTELTGTLYEDGERPPSFEGSPDPGATYTWVCDACYEVESGGQRQRIGDREVRVAFESPLPRGFEDRERAIAAAKEHVRTQFARLGVAPGEVEVEVEVAPAEAT